MFSSISPPVLLSLPLSLLELEPESLELPLLLLSLLPLESGDVVVVSVSLLDSEVSAVLVGDVIVADVVAFVVVGDVPLLLLSSEPPSAVVPSSPHDASESAARTIPIPGERHMGAQTSDARRRAPARTQPCDESRDFDGAICHADVALALQHGRGVSPLACPTRCRVRRVVRLADA
ncbi:MAG TPA: hypothetical protein VG755_02790 [Nannocystaceae bacterium]|nr:hypothetical protein [Nannocystaceae bacterium]